MPTTPPDIVNRALDLIGVSECISDIQDGSRISTVALRHYGPALRQLSRAAHWNSLRKRAPLTLLQDATGQTTQAQITAGQTPTVGTGTPGMPPWVYEYAWPIDCIKARFVPMTMHNNGTGIPPGNIAIPSNPLMSGLNAAPFHRQIPTRFVVATDAVPNLIGVPASWNAVPETNTLMGQGLTSQTVILSNQRDAHLVYTALVPYPDQWDSLFQQAFVALLASYFALPLLADKKMAVAIRNEQIQIAKGALDHARVNDGNEGFFSSDIQVDWLRIRNTGMGGGIGYDGAGVLGYGWDSMNFSNGDAY